MFSLPLLSSNNILNDLNNALYGNDRVKSRQIRKCWTAEHTAILSEEVEKVIRARLSPISKKQLAESLCGSLNFHRETIAIKLTEFSTSYVENKRNDLEKRIQLAYVLKVKITNDFLNEMEAHGTVTRNVSGYLVSFESNDLSFLPNVPPLRIHASRLDPAKVPRQSSGLQSGIFPNYALLGQQPFPNLGGQTAPLDWTLIQPDPQMSNGKIVAPHDRTAARHAPYDLPNGQDSNFLQLQRMATQHFHSMIFNLNNLGDQTHLSNDTSLLNTSASVQQKSCQGTIPANQNLTVQINPNVLDYSNPNMQCSSSNTSDDVVNSPNVSSPAPAQESPHKNSTVTNSERTPSPEDLALSLFAKEKYASRLPTPTTNSYDFLWRLSDLFKHLSIKNPTLQDFWDKFDDLTGKRVQELMNKELTFTQVSAYLEDALDVICRKSSIHHKGAVDCSMKHFLEKLQTLIGTYNAPFCRQSFESLTKSIDSKLEKLDDEMLSSKAISFGFSFVFFEFGII